LSFETYLKILEILTGEFAQWNAPIVTFVALSSKNPYQVLISTLLSLRTKDEVTSGAVKRLFARASTPEEMVKLKEEEIQKLIYPVGFYRNKAVLLIDVSRRILEEFDGKVPQDLQTLLSFKGVGRKTANLVLALGYGIPAICVDVHVHRISNRLGFVKTKTPEETEFALMKQVPETYWSRINDLMVGFGQVICKPVSPFCSKCPVAGFCAKKGVEKNR
jgi:endonuclease-3